MAQQQLSVKEREIAALKAQEEYRQRIRELVILLLTGGIGLFLWRHHMREEIRRLHFVVAVIAGGNIEQDVELYNRILSNVARQMQYFERWITQLQGATLSMEQFNAIVNRAGMYGTASGETFFNALTRALGLPFMPFYPKDRTVCKVGCCCHWDYKSLRGDGNWNMKWMLDPECDHCPTCNARARAANPLKVRNGRIVNPERYQDARLYA